MSLSNDDRKRIISSVVNFDLFNCNNLQNLIGSIQNEIPINSFSGTRLYHCYKSGFNKAGTKWSQHFLVKLIFYNKSTNEIYNNKKYVSPINSGVVFKATDKIEKILNLKFKPSNIYTSMSDTDIFISILFDNPKYKLFNITPCFMEIVVCKKCDGVDKLLPNKTICDVSATTSNISSEYGKEPGLPNINLFTHQKPNFENSLNELLCNYRNNIKSELSFDSIAFVSTEYIPMSFKELVLHYDDISHNLHFMKAILFHIIRGYYAIKQLFPKFIHGDLHLSNILIKKMTTEIPNSYYEYIIDNKSFYIPTIGVIPKIIDFGFSRLPEYNIYSSIEGDKRKIVIEDDNDICMLFNRIYLNLIPDKHPMLISLLDKIDIKKTYRNYNRDVLKKHPEKITSIGEMMKSSAWDDYNIKINPNQIFYTFIDVKKN